MLSYLEILLFFVVAVAASIAALRYYFRYQDRADKWPSVNAQRGRWSVKETEWEGSTYFEVRVQLRYTVKETQYSTAVREEFTSEKSAKEFVDGFGEGPLVVYYDPKKPSRVALTRGPAALDLR